jgi:hypothetical protein
MTEIQQQLIARITAPSKTKYLATRASFNGRFLNCEGEVTSSGKIKKQKFSFMFDSAEDCQGCRAVGKTSGTYSEHFRKDVFEVICEFSAEIAKLEV